MIVYNITIKIDPGIEAAWVRWQQDEHIADVMSSGRFTGYKFYRLLEPVEKEGPTYVVQYFASSLEDYQQYLDETAPLLRRKALEKWGDQFIAFRTVMQVVH